MVNEEYCKMTGYSREEEIGTTWLRHIVPCDQERLREYNSHRFTDPENAPDKYEFSFINKKGEIVNAMMSVAPVPGMRKIIASFTDISRIKQTEIRLQKLAAEMTVKSENVNLLLSIIAHDLRNPFNAIIGLTSILLDNLPERSLIEINKFITLINTESKQAFFLLEDLLAWAKSQQDKVLFNPQPLNLPEVCRDVVCNISVYADEKQIAIDLNPEPDAHPEPIIVTADKNMIKTVIRNLISNAVKFSIPGSAIHIQTESQDHEVSVSVIDHGVGIEEKNMKKLWSISEKYTTPGTANERGNGLGLILCKEFVEKHGGRIWAESEPGNGSRFIFTLPKNGDESCPEKPSR
ncbi:MAG TPA: PAS domain-containing sensor histidine kinase, partial [Paludibacteraceae bacterium]|nr:PAS domain-containing sensor histidine kinase [Paludibacteraceae bacterium]